MKKRSILRYLLPVFLGNAVYAISAAMFILPVTLMSSGTTGIALVLQHFFGIPIPPFVFCFNLLMLGCGWIILGKRFAMTTVLSSVIYPFLLDLALRLLDGLVITENLLLCAVFGGMGLGIGLGVVIRAGASTGGMDIPPLVLQKLFRIPVSGSLAAFDFGILVLQLAFHKPEDLLYGILLILATSAAMNKVLLAGTSRTEVKVVSSHAQEIRKEILSTVDRGVTVLHGEGGFTHQPTEVILSVISNHELPKIEQLVRRIDPESFIIVSHVTEVWGRGFTTGKKYYT